ncbi:uncharacterized protein LOC112596429 [Melanaphis sacchari]|uniref:RlpA-like protein n=1 Tax=Melanaphis sacchari TaxID=742174 RepID=A0A2H8U012_9HEMI|nr:uncharacterized protein LOC112596429 [Melanaphis sacchari]
MKEATVVWAKLFLILIISTKPLGLNGLSECKHLGNNSCLGHNECCSGYCYKEPGWELGVCKRAESAEQLEDEENVFEKGVCAFYKGGNTTASGDVFDENEMTAAHRTLPFNTMVKVEIMGASVVVKINDRTNNSNPHTLDMSLAAATSIGINDRGDVQCQLILVNYVGCTPDLGNTCVMHHECCSQNCFREMFSEVGFCIPK